MPIKPEELYTNKDKQQDYPQIYNGDELVAIVISFPLEEEEEDVEVNMSDAKEPSINASQILAKGGANVELLDKKDKDQENMEILKLKKKLKEADDGRYLQNDKSVNPITQAFLKVTTLKKIAEEQDGSENQISNPKIRIYLTNLGKYNEGEMVGEWVTLPVKDFKPILDRIGINKEYEEWFITDYEAPFKIGEYDSLDDLNDIAEAGKGFDEIDWIAFSEYLDNSFSKEEALQKTKDHDYFFLRGNNDKEAGMSYIEEIGGITALPKEDLIEHFDYDSYGRDLIINGDYRKVKDGYISLE